MGRIALWLVCALLALCLWPVDVLHITTDNPMRKDGGLIYSSPALPGFAYATRILHSVQLSPVEDYYYVAQGRIWAWQERIMSHNAGLPSLPPERGRFLFDPPWMILEGTHAAWEEIIYRVGTDDLGKNELHLPGTGWLALAHFYPGARLRFFVKQSPLGAALLLAIPFRRELLGDW